MNWLRMRRFTLRRYLAFFLPAMFIILFLSLYLMMESVAVYGTSSMSSQERSDDRLENKLHQIEENLKSNQETINRIKDLIRDIAKNNGRNDWNQILDGVVGKHEAIKHPDVSNALYWNKNEISIPLETCKLADTMPPKVDVQMRDVFDKLAFDNPDGGVWKQGFDISYDVKQWKKEKLKVFVVPHSHCDPGWIKTFDAYYQDQTRHILDNMVDKLEQHPTMRFVYAEMSFFTLWWSHLDNSVRNRVKKLLNEKRLEIISGGWVMTDEANAHYFAMVDQMIEGNQWLLNQLGVKPVSSWAIDPFGYSSTMAYIVHQLGFKNMLIQRVHYSVKKYFSQKKQLEFAWRQTWDHSGTTDMFCHMMPFYSYDVPHTCGPNPKVCCQFDFKRLVGGSFKCPWNIPPVPINPDNVEERAETLLDQYRQKSQLYKNNVLLIPLGDDFRYDKAEEWDQQHDNYQQLFNYINKKTELNAEIRFGTLSDYFDALRGRANKTGSSFLSGFPVLSGDFFPYADRDDHYWSGYYTSRPFYKRLDRVLESHQRGGEILYSLALAESYLSHAKTFPKEELLAKLVSARRNLGLFQHHDAIAGTAKDFVMADYGAKLLSAINNLKQVIKDSAEFLLTPDKETYDYLGTAVFDVDETRASHDALPEKTVIDVKTESQGIVFYNSLAHNRTTLVTIYVNEPHIEIHDVDGVTLPTQVSPFWTESKDISESIYRVSFTGTIPALGLVKYLIRKVEPGANPLNFFASITFYNAEKSSKSQIGPFAVEHKSKSDSDENTFSLENAEMELHFSLETGMLKEVMLMDSEDLVRTEVVFVRYGTRPGKDRSGAYLFIPDGEAQSVMYDSHPTIRKTEGPLVSEMQVALPFVDHTVTVVNSPGVDSSAIEIMNLVDIRHEGNTEVAMRIMTDINSDNEFFTDLNGFQVLRRKTRDKLPLNGNFYPMPTMSFLEDQIHRVSILSGQSLGVASLKKGWLEVMQDRRLDQDDQRGLAQPVHDNKVTPNLFRLLVEQRSSPTAMVIQPSAYPSLLSHLISQQMLHPVHVLPAGKKGTSAAQSLLSTFQPLKHELPCDMHLVNLRTLLKPEDGATFQPADETGLILHRLGLDCRFKMKGASCHLNSDQISLSTMFRVLPVSYARQMTLSFGDQLASVNLSAALDIPSMEIRAFSVRLR